MFNIIPSLQAAAPQGGGVDLLQFLPMILVFVLMYFFFIRTQQKKDKKHKEMLSALKVGETVVTQSGLFGKVTGLVDETEVLLEVSPGVVVRCLKSMVASVSLKKETKQVRSLEKKSSAAAKKSAGAKVTDKTKKKSA